MNIGDLIRMIAGENVVYSQVCKVTEVDAEKMLIDAIPINGDAEIFDVRLSTTPNQDLSTVILVPKLDSLVVVNFLNENTGYVALCEDVSSVLMDIDGRKIELDKSGFAYEFQNVSLKESNDKLLDLLGDIISTIQTLKVVTPMGVSTNLTPDSIAKVNKAKVDLGIVKSDFNRLLK